MSYSYCNLCKSRDVKFLDFNKRQEVQCSSCKSLERHRMSGIYFESNPIESNFVVLHIAPELITYQYLSSKSLNYESGDLFPQLYKDIPNVKKMDLTALPHGNETFDFVYASHILEHIPEDKKAINEIFRVTKKNGSALIMVPQDLRRETTYEDFSITSPQDRLKHFGQTDHVRWYGRDFSQRLIDAGFNVKIYYHPKITSVAIKLPAHEYIQISNKNELRLNHNDIVYICTKKN